MRTMPKGTDRSTFQYSGAILATVLCIWESIMLQSLWDPPPCRLMLSPPARTLAWGLPIASKYVNEWGIDYIFVLARFEDLIRAGFAEVSHVSKAQILHVFFSAARIGQVLRPTFCQVEVIFSAAWQLLSSAGNFLFNGLGVNVTFV